MSLTLELGRGVLGLGLAILLGRDLSVSLAGALISGIIGGGAIPVYFVSATLLRSGADLFGTPGKFNRGLNQVDCQYLMQHRAMSLAIGVLLSMAALLLGWQGLAIGASIFCAAVSLWLVFGVNTYFWLACVSVGGLVLIGQYFGLDNAPLIALMFINSLGAQIQLRVKEPLSFEEIGPDLMLWMSGICGAIVPAVNPGLYIDRETYGWTVSAIADGFSLGFCLLARDSSKTAIGTIMSQFAPQLDPYTAIILVGLALSFCLLPGSIKFSCRQPAFPNWTQGLLIVGATSWYLTIPGQPLLTLCLSGLLYAGLSLATKCSPQVLPTRFQFGLGAAPTLLL
jgi:hypothetical protein